MRVKRREKKVNAPSLADPLGSLTGSFHYNSEKINPKIRRRVSVRVPAFLIYIEN